MPDYGLPTKRDSDGNLQAVDHTYQWGGDEITIRLIPPTISEQEEYESLGVDTTYQDLVEIVEKHLVEPDISDIELSTRELNCYLDGIRDYGMNGNGMAAAVQEELEARAGEEGN